MKDPNESLLLDHEVDGIRELDNKLPRWWVWLFYLSIAFSAVYLGYYHVFHAGALQVEEYNLQMARGETIKAAAIARFEQGIVGMEPLQDSAVVIQGRHTFQTLCAPCHRQDAGGLVGPNLTDEFWLHGDTFADNLKVIWDGIPEKGMVSWKGVLQPRDIHAVASYIFTLRGSDPPNPKPPENLAPADTGPSMFE
jgi:cytochrome c oxidase cbb3-type subunit 3